MASIISRRPLLTTATSLGILASAAYLSRPRPIMLDSAQNAAAQTLSMPRTMLFSKQLKVVNVKQVNHDTKRITFALPDGDENKVSGVTPGAAILTQHTPAGAWLPVFRPYTPIHDLDERGLVELLVKKYPNGRASTHLHSLTPGQELTVRGPLPAHWTVPKDQRDVLLVAGGAGITPVYSLTKGILSNPADPTRIRLLWGVNGTRDIVLKDELEQLEKQYPDRLHVTYAVSGPEAKADAPSLGDEKKYRKGYVDKSLLQEAIEECRKGSWGDEKGQKVFLCGPPKMEEALAGKTGVLAELGVEKKEIHRF